MAGGAVASASTARRIACSSPPSSAVSETLRVCSPASSVTDQRAPILTSDTVHASPAGLRLSARRTPASIGPRASLSTPATRILSREAGGADPTGGRAVGTGLLEPRGDRGGTVRMVELTSQDAIGRCDLLHAPRAAPPRPRPAALRQTRAAGARPRSPGAPRRARAPARGGARRARRGGRGLARARAGCVPRVTRLRPGRRGGGCAPPVRTRLLLRGTRRRRRRRSRRPLRRLRQRTHGWHRRQRHARHHLEAGWLELLLEPARCRARRAVGQRQQRAADLLQQPRADRVAVPLQVHSRPRLAGLERLALLTRGGAQLLGRSRVLVRAAQPARRGLQALPLGARVPHDLVCRPRRDTRLAQALRSRSAALVARGLQLRGQRLASGGELAERQAVDVVHSGIIAPAVAGRKAGGAPTPMSRSFHGPSRRLR